MTTLVEVTKQPTRDAKISLFRLDATKIGGGIEFFCQGKLGDASVFYGTQEYRPIDIEMSGFETNVGGTLPQPTLRIANSDSFIQDAVNTIGDLAGCEVRRVVTFKRFLDEQSEPDETAFVGPEIFRIERKSEENPNYIEWELSAAIDQEGKMIPGDVVIRDTCTRRYRRYDPTNQAAAPDGFVYATIKPCPYTGTNSFDALNQATTSDKDQCSFALTGCRLRFGADQPIPFGGFPGAARVS